MEWNAADSCYVTNYVVTYLVFIYSILSVFINNFILSVSPCLSLSFIIFSLQSVIKYEIINDMNVCMCHYVT